MERVAVVGPGGAGKSTFCRALGACTGLPVIHLDWSYWKPGWVEPTRQEWETVQAGLVGGDRWIADGNYGRTLDVRLSRADTVIILAPRRLVCVLGALARAVRHRGQSLQASGCPERLKIEFLRWIWNYPTASRPHLDAAIARHPHLRVIEFSSRRAAADWLSRGEATRDGGSP